MEKKHTIFSYLIQVFMIYGIGNLLLNIFALIFGASAIEYSTIFSIGNKGVGIATCFQFFCAMALIVAIEYFFTSDFMIKKLSFVPRTALLFGCALAVIIGFILIFGWFPPDEILPWIMFMVCFLISFGISAVVSTAYERSENKKMAEALQKFKEEQ